MFLLHLEMSSTSLNNENIDFNAYRNITNYENISSIDEQVVNKPHTPVLLSSIETGNGGKLLLFQQNDQQVENRKKRKKKP